MKIYLRKSLDLACVLPLTVTGSIVCTVNFARCSASCVNGSLAQCDTERKSATNGNNCCQGECSYTELKQQQKQKRVNDHLSRPDASRCLCERNLTLTGDVRGGQFHSARFIVRRERAQVHVGVQRLIGPEVDAQVVHVTRRQVLPERGHVQTGHRLRHQETIYTTAKHNDTNCKMLIA